MNLDEKIASRLLLKNELVSIKKILDREDIPFLIIKGFALSNSIYKNELDRDFSDIDIYIKNSHLAKTLNLFYSIGFVNIRGWIPTTISKQIPLQKLSLNQKINIDLHFELTIFPFMNDAFAFDRCFYESIEFFIDKYKFNTFCPTDNYLYLRYHLLLEKKRGNINVQKWENDIKLLKEKYDIKLPSYKLYNDAKWLLSENISKLQFSSHKDEFVKNLNKKSSSISYQLFKLKYSESKLKFLKEVLFPPKEELQYTNKYTTRFHRLFKLK